LIKILKQLWNPIVGEIQEEDAMPTIKDLIEGLIENL
jgi:hypothetical protein